MIKIFPAAFLLIAAALLPACGCPSVNVAKNLAIGLGPIQIESLRDCSVSSFEVAAKDLPPKSPLRDAAVGAKIIHVGKLILQRAEFSDEPGTHLYATDDFETQLAVWVQSEIIKVEVRVKK